MRGWRPLCVLCFLMLPRCNFVLFGATELHSFCVCGGGGGGSYVSLYECVVADLFQYVHSFVCGIGHLCETL